MKNLITVSLILFMLGTVGCSNNSTAPKVAVPAKGDPMLVFQNTSAVLLTANMNGGTYPVAPNNTTGLALASGTYPITLTSPSILFTNGTNTISGSVNLTADHTITVSGTSTLAVIW